MRQKHFSRAWKQIHRNFAKGFTPIFGSHGAKEEPDQLHISRADRRKSMRHNRHQSR